MSMASGKRNLEAEIAAEAAKLGFANCGFAPATLGPENAARFQQWLEGGCDGDMLGMSYAPGRDPFALAEHPDRARISVYAQGGDYHKTVKSALKALARWIVEQVNDAEVQVFVDTAPVMEKPLAMAAGLGWQGKHTNLVSRSHGSWLFLGAIYTTLELAPSGAGRDRCGSCTACQTVCPTDAFPAPDGLQERRCISYLTIEHA